ncbi:cellulase family glycosylhydrolase [Streptomyces sp. NPDC023723]|uniref:cellulase family glycosylhydrolase n=1 Tax=Streptomyces sp. NPDC023723 TaxID=3154323 RepID=UPI0033E16BAC
MSTRFEQGEEPERFGQLASRRRVLRALAAAPAVVALAGCGTGTDAKSGETAGTAASPYELPSTAGRAGGGRTKPLDFGLAYSDTLPWMSDADLAQALDDAADLGITWIRADLAWTNIQPDSPTQYLWERFDRVASAARERDLTVLATLGYTPQWSRDAACMYKNQSCPPADNARFAQFATEAVTRYAAMGVHAWQIWNEPNISGFWPGGPDPERYTDMLAQVSQAVRAADSEAFVVMAGLANADTEGAGKRQSAADFLDAALKLGAAEHIDAVSFHPFSRTLLPSTKTGDSPYERVDGARKSLTAVLKSYEQTGLEIWLTETGSPTHGRGAAADSEQPGEDATHATAGFQAKIATDTVPAADALGAVTKVFWYSHRDTKPPEANAVGSHYYGLIEYTGEHKPSFAAYRDAIADYRAQN